MPGKYRRRRTHRSHHLRRLLMLLVIGGVFSSVAVLVGGMYALHHFDLTPRQFVVAVVEKSGIGSSWIHELATPAAAFSRHRFDGYLREDHPRILFPELAGKSTAERLAVMQKRRQAYLEKKLVPVDGCSGGVMGLAACWFSKGGQSMGQAAVDAMAAFKLNKPNASGEYGNGWKLAFAYDLMHGYSGFGDDAKALVREKIQQALRDTLVLLNGDSASLWHGRTTLAAHAWLCAVVLDPDTHELQGLINQAQAHFLSTMRALELTEAWPEGYSYWINNRAFPLVLAGAAYLNGLQEAKRAEGIRAAFRRTGLWHLYATRPDNRVEGLGDEGPRVDLKDETRRVIDLLVSITRDPALVRYSRFLGELHGDESYFQGYRWGFYLFNDPSVPDLGHINGAQLSPLDEYLPRAELFGRRALNLAYIRSGWSQDDTFISFRAGDNFTHHGHYDAGHFTLFKGAPLAITSGTYAPFRSEHRKNYAIRTVAKNSLLILRPGEKVHPNNLFEPNVSDGGQRITMPTGSAITSPGHWAENRGAGKHLEGGKLLSFHNEKGQYAYVAADLTRAYNTPQFDSGGSGGKVQKVVRELLYLYPEDRLFIHDYVVSTQADYQKKWLLHTVSRPQVEGLQLLKGAVNNGILESKAVVARVENGRGRLRLDRIYPEDAVIRLVGGKDYRFYVEADGDDSELDGKNMEAGANLKPWFDTGAWRIEVQPKEGRLEDHFLHILSPGLDEYRQDSVQPLTLGDTASRGVMTSDSLVIFPNRQMQGQINLDYSGKRKQLYVAGLPSMAALKIRGASNTTSVIVNDAGVAQIDLSQFQPGVLELAW